MYQEFTDISCKKSKIYLAVHDLIMCCHGMLNRLVQDRRNVWEHGGLGPTRFWQIS